MAIFRIPSYVMGNRKFKLAAVKQDLPVSQLLDNIATPLQLTLCFEVQELKGKGIIADCPMNRTRSFKMRQESNQFPTTTPFFGSGIIHNIEFLDLETWCSRWNGIASLSTNRVQ